MEKKTCVIYDEPPRKDEFLISYGNLMVLKTIPEMMIEPSWRNKLRKLVLDYNTSKILKGVKLSNKIKQ